MDDTDFDLLCKGLSADEAKRMRKIFMEWCDGDENGFPVQLVLLTRAQWRAAAMLPNFIKDSGKAIERHLAECRQHCAAIIKNLSNATENSAAELKNIVQMHTETVSKVSASFHNELWQTEQVAKQIQDTLGSGISERNKSQDALVRERQRFENVCQKLDDAINLRGVHWYIAGTLAACGVALLLGHYAWHH